MDLQNYIRDVRDFPKKGVIFKDITPLLNNPSALRYCADQLSARLEAQAIDKVVGIEARGFIMGSMLADRLSAGFVPVRKKGKLPFSTVQREYTLEYGTAVLEIHTDAIRKGDRVVIHDDVLATGGTASAVESLVNQLGGVVVQCNFLIALDFLKGKEKLKSPIVALQNY